RAKFPKSSIPRRNTGYALDLLVNTDPFTAGGDPFNFCTLLCGSEGTLALITEIKLNLVPKPSRPSGLLCIHFSSLDEALRANLVVIKHKPLVSELMDRYILECTKTNMRQSNNRFFIDGDPEAIFIAEYDGADEQEIRTKVEQVKSDLLSQGLGYSFPLVLSEGKKRVWELRK